MGALLCGSYGQGVWDPREGHVHRQQLIEFGCVEYCIQSDIRIRVPRVASDHSIPERALCVRLQLKGVEASY